MDLLANLKKTFDSGDPEIRSWALVNSYYAPFLLSGAYLLTVTKIAPEMMRDRKPMQLKKLMILYNFFIVAIYACSLTYVIWKFLTTDSSRCICNDCLVIRGHQIYSMITVGWVIYLLKYLEFADTIFFVLRKKDHLVTNLHLIHHSSLPIIGWVLLRTERSGFHSIPTLINCAVHAIMYTYYGLSAMGPEVRKYLWWKKQLTMLQISQFIIILMYVLILGPLSGCKTTRYGSSTVTVFVVIFLALFYNFYQKEYFLKSRNKVHKG